MTPSLAQIERRRRRLLMLSYVVILFLSTTLIGLLFFIDGLVGLLNAVKYNAFLRVYLIVFVAAFLLYMTHKERQQYTLTEQLMDNLRETSTMLAEELKRDIFLNKTSQNFASFPSAQALPALLSLASEHFDADGGAIVNRKQAGGWEPVVAPEGDENDQLVSDVADWVEKTGRTLVLPSSDAAGTPELGTDSDLGSILGVPLRLRGRLHGVVTLWRGSNKPAFAEPDTRLMEIAGRQAATVVYNHEQSVRDQERLGNICRLVARATDRLNPEFEASSERSGRLSGLVAYEMNLLPDEQRYITTAAYLQNAGLLTLPAKLLEQQAFTDAEEDIVESHLAAGAELLRAMKFPRGVADIITLSRRLHTEEGATGLAGKDVPIGAFVIAAVNAYLERCSADNTDLHQIVELARRESTPTIPDEVFDALLAVVDEEALADQRSRHVTA